MIRSMRALASRIIPARAGSTRIRIHDIPQLEDHPRSCEEHLPWYRLACLPCGSSPLVRGARRGYGACGGLVRIIPARAGSTGHHLVGLGALRDHPRSCGEHPK